MPENSAEMAIYRVADLSPRKPLRFELRPEKSRCKAMAHDLGLLDLRKLSFIGELRADGKSDWRLKARLGATVEQSCVITLAPVTTRLDIDVTRLFTPDIADPDTDDETEMPDDIATERLGTQIDLAAVMTEALVLALPDYPRHPDAELAQSNFTAPGERPMSDDDAKPFAGLASLRDKLQKDD